MILFWLAWRAGGTRWLGNARPCAADAACVAPLRACGAVLAGKANMHELGAGTSGINPHHGYVFVYVYAYVYASSSALLHVRPRTCAGQQTHVLWQAEHSYLILY